MLRRWLKFNAVGIAGALVQLAALWLLARVLGIEYVLATVLAVEVAILHNFAWHELWTWRGVTNSGRGARLLKFHLGNGLVSIVANPPLTWIFVHFAHVPLLAANVAAIVCVAVVNFIIAERWVFTG